MLLYCIFFVRLVFRCEKLNDEGGNEMLDWIVEVGLRWIDMNDEMRFFFFILVRLVWSLFEELGRWKKEKWKRGIFYRLKGYRLIRFKKIKYL